MLEKIFKMKQKGEFLGILLGTLAASLLGTTLAGRGVIRAVEGVVRAGKEHYF